MYRVVFVGCGFAGLFAAKALRRAPVEVVMVDRRNRDLFQALIYQVATGVLTGPSRFLGRGRRQRTITKQPGARPHPRTPVARRVLAQATTEFETTRAR